MYLYGVKRVDITELDPTTGTSKSSGKKFTIKTAQKVELEPVMSEGEESILRNASNILAIVRTDDLLYGYDLTFTDNSFDPELAGLIAGYKVTGQDTTLKIETPMGDEGVVAKPFKMEIYVANYDGDSIENYIKVTLNKCYGKFINMSLGDEFYAPEFNVKARENTKASLPIKQIEVVTSLPASSPVL